MAWRKSVYDQLILTGWGYEDLEFVWDDVEQVDPDEQAQRNLDMIKIGLKSVDEVRAEMGLPGLGMGHAIWGIGPMGMMFVPDLLKAQKMGQMLPPLQAPPDMGAPPQIGPDGQPIPQPPQLIQQTGAPLDGSPDPNAMPPGMAPGGAPPGMPAPQQAPNMHPGAQAGLEGIPPELLAAVGLGPQGPAGRSVDVTAHEALTSHPDAHGAATKQVLATLLAAEKQHQGAAP